MKLSTIYTLLFVLSTFNLAAGQDSSLSKHEFSFYINNVKKSIQNLELSIIISGDTMKAKKVGEFFYFPVIDTAKNFDLEVKINNIIFHAQDYKGWMLNRGTRIIFGKLTKFRKLLSVAEDSDMTKNDEEWEWYSKRFYVVDRIYTLDIENRDKLNELQFLIFIPKNSNFLMTTQKEIR